MHLLTSNPVSSLSFSYCLLYSAESRILQEAAWDIQQTGVVAGMGKGDRVQGKVAIGWVLQRCVFTHILVDGCSKHGDASTVWGLSFPADLDSCKRSPAQLSDTRMPFIRHPCRPNGIRWPQPAPAVQPLGKSWLQIPVKQLQCMSLGRYVN